MNGICICRYLAYLHMPYFSIFIYAYHMHIYTYWIICFNMLIRHILAYNVLIFEVNSQRWPQTIGIPFFSLLPSFLSPILSFFSLFSFFSFLTFLQFFVVSGFHGRTTLPHGLDSLPKRSQLRE